MDIWEDYNFLNFYLPEIHKGIKEDSLPKFELEHLYSRRKSKYKKDDLYGVVDHLTKSVVPVRTLLKAVSTTEHFLQAVAYRVYRDHQYKLKAKVDSIEQANKLLNVIVDSTDKDEIINRIAEEKIRGIFYGNPVDFFVKDKAKLGLNTYFKDYYSSAIEIYSEIIARRNIYTHNDGKVDRKYKREIKNSIIPLGRIAPIDTEYLKQTIIILRGFSVIVTKLVLENTYRTSNTNKLIKNKFETFEKKFKNK